MAFNPVERCLLKLCDHWVGFRDDTSKRLLVWQANPNALRFFHCFFEVQKHETDYTVGDLFIVLNVPFENAIQYSRDLKKELAGQYEASHEELLQQGITPDWIFQPETYTDSSAGFVRSLLSFGSKHHECIGHLVAVLMPGAVADEDGFAAWLMRVLQTQPPERLRFVVVDSSETLRLRLNSNAGHVEAIQFSTPKIDALTTAQETFAQERTFGPAGAFRNLLIGLMSLIEKGTIEQIKVKASDALNFARKEKWLDQQVVVTMLVAGAMLKEKQLEQALQGYQEARKMAEQATAAGHPVGRQLELQTWFGEAGVYLAAGNSRQAAHGYEQAASLAQQISNLILGIEAFRMGSFCLARMNAPDLAIQRGWQALDLGRKLKPEARGMTTLPIAAIDLLRVIDTDRVVCMEHIKYQHNVRIDTLRKRTNQRVKQLEPCDEPIEFRAVEELLNKETAQACQDAIQKIDAVAAASGETFQKYYSQARDLLGDPWPFDALTGVAQPGTV